MGGDLGECLELILNPVSKSQVLPVTFLDVGLKASSHGIGKTVTMW